MTNVVVIMTAQRGPVRLDEATREELERALTDTVCERDKLLDHRAKAAQVQVARPLAEWDESDGPVLWWKFPIEEPPYLGTPNDLGFTVELHTRDNPYGARMAARGQVGGWPGYHTHWTPLPPVPVRPS